MNSFIASSARRDLQRTLHGFHIRARARMFKAMLAEFGGQEKRMSTRHKGLFFQDKTAEAGTVRDKMPRYPEKCAGIVQTRRGSSSQWRTSSPRAASSASTP